MQLVACTDHFINICTERLVSVLSYKIIYHLGFFQQECDQVHIDDVSSDDNGQDLR